jgi:hypothetical protein
MIMEHYWEISLRSISKFSEQLISLKPLNYFSWKIRSGLSFAFWGYHFLVLALILLNGNLSVVDGKIVKAAYLPLLVLWAIYGFNLVFVYLPASGLNELYGYLREKNLEPSHAIVISILTAIGVVASIFVFVHYI